jgi:hypothetical protein
MIADRQSEKPSCLSLSNHLHRTLPSCLGPVHRVASQATIRQYYKQVKKLSTHDNTLASSFNHSIMAHQQTTSDSPSDQRQLLPSREPVLPSPDDGGGYRPTHISGVYIRVTKMIGLTSVGWLPHRNETKEEDRIKIGPSVSNWDDAMDSTKYGSNSKWGANTVDTKSWSGLRVPGLFVKRDEVVGVVVVNWVDRGVESTCHISQQ